ncbi:MAG: acyltransferase [Pseudomonadota bacterium]
MSTQDKHWASVKSMNFLFGMRVMLWIFRVFGRLPFRLVLYPVLFWYVVTRKAPRQASLDFLHRVNSSVAPETGLKIQGRMQVRTGVLGVLMHFASFAETMLDKMLLWSGQFKLASIDFFGREQLDKCVAEKRGAILVCSHLGNLELTRVLSKGREGIKITVLAHTKHAQAFSKMLEELDPDSQLNMLAVTEITPATAMLLNDKIAQGEFIVITGDRIPVAANPRVAISDFLGAPAAFPIGPYVLASILQCPIYLLFTTQRNKHYEVHFELMSDSIRLPRKGRDQVLAGLVAQYAARLEYHCLRAPLQWFNFFDFWHLPQQDL